MTQRNKKRTIEAQEGTPQCPTDPHDKPEKFRAWKWHMEELYRQHFGSHQAADYRQSLHVVPDEVAAKAGEGE